MLESLLSFTKIGIACSAEAPGDRMAIKDAITELHATKARLLWTRILFLLMQKRDSRHAKEKVKAIDKTESRTWLISIPYIN